MSTPKLPLDISRRAQRDVRVILNRTLLEWGEPQVVIYRQALRSALEALSDFPELGRAREELGPGYRSFVVEKHVIFYKIYPDRVYIDRILDGRMDARRALRGRR